MEWDEIGILHIFTSIGNNVDDFRRRMSLAALSSRAHLRFVYFSHSICVMQFRCVFVSRCFFSLLSLLRTLLSCIEILFFLFGLMYISDIFGLQQINRFNFIKLCVKYFGQAFCQHHAILAIDFYSHSLSHSFLSFSLYFWLNIYKMWFGFVCTCNNSASLMC